ncbi:5-hydroxytryptamine receptor 7-like [Acanthaster planci]|uniref:5-hydroxytryptamine receptor 7-like n=1 Tax=Acanthaster planci TaxID=133434 RepID=A0A8B7XIF2_ACAPL|nr:5-hydroxytryptamine receptor 7-like [Acanthaster planci]
MDTSTDTHQYEFSDYTQRVMVATLLMIVTVVGVVGNSMVILAALLSKSLQTKTITFFVNMSAAHLTTALVLPWDVVALLSNGDFPRGDHEWICSVTTVVISITVGCGIYTLAFIGLNHFLLITQPTTYQKVFTPRKMAVWLIVTWLIPFLVILVPPLINVGEVGFNQKFHLCGTKSSNAWSFKVYNSIRVLGLYPIPLVCIITCYTLIYVHQQRKGQTLGSSSYQDPCDDRSLDSDITQGQGEKSAASIDQSGSSSVSSHVVGQTQMLTETMPFIIFGFVALLTPYAVCLFVRRLEPFVPYASGILFSSTCINPIIYGSRHRDFKIVFSSILRCRWNDIPQSSTFLKMVGWSKSREKETVGSHGHAD